MGSIISAIDDNKEEWMDENGKYKPNSDNINIFPTKLDLSIEGDELDAIRRAEERWKKHSKEEFSYLMALFVVNELRKGE